MIFSTSCEIETRSLIKVKITILDPYSLDHFFARFWYIYPKNLSIIDDRTKSMEKGRMSMPS